MQHWIHSDKQRYYSAVILQDLFGDWVLQRAWGDLHSKRGGFRLDYYDSEKAALEALQALHKRRRQRGYKNLKSV